MNCECNEVTRTCVCLYRRHSGLEFSVSRRWLGVGDVWCCGWLIRRDWMSDVSG